MKNVAIFQSYLFGFRVPILNELNKKINVTVFHGGYKKPVDTDIQFDTVDSKLKVFISMFWIQKLNNFNINNFDTVILMLDAKILSNFWIALLAKYKKKKVVVWGIGFGKSKLANILRLILVSLSDSVLLYSQSSKKEFINRGVKEDKIFVANNTVDFGVENDFYIEPPSDNEYLFVGALEERKGLDELIDSFSKKASAASLLHIVGDGPLKMHLLTKVAEQGLEQRVIFYGNITDKSKLLDLYHRCSFSLSLRQAGLSVLQSFAFARPFVTYSNSITGGERENIVDSENGFLLSKDNVFHSIDDFFSHDFSKIELKRLFMNAKKTYETSASPSNMVQSIYEAIQ